MRLEKIAHVSPVKPHVWQVACEERWGVWDEGPPLLWAGLWSTEFRLCR